MTPSNPDNQQPLIYRIADALGVFHLVAPVNHTHSQDEIEGLAAALAAKQDALTFDSAPTAGSTNPVTSGGVKAALDSKSNLVGQTISLVINGQEIEIEPSDVPNLIRALSNPDTTPTASSNNLVTSGGVKTALDDKADQNHMHSNIGDDYSSITAGDGEINIELSDPVTHSGGELDITVNKLPNLQRAINTPDSTPTANSDNLVTSGGVAAALVAKANKDDVEFKVFEKNAASDKINLSTDFVQGQKRATYLIFNYTSDACALSDLFTYRSGEIVTAIVLPTTEQPAIQVDRAVVVSVLKYSDDSAINYIIVPESYY